jgi:hypothetical protein
MNRMTHDRYRTTLHSDLVSCIQESLYQFPLDGMHLLVTAGHKVLMYSVETGELEQKLKGHKDTVYCLSWGTDGKKFASGR